MTSVSQNSTAVARVAVTEEDGMAAARAIVRFSTESSSTRMMSELV